MSHKAVSTSVYGVDRLGLSARAVTMLMAIGCLPSLVVFHCLVGCFNPILTAPRTAREVRQVASATRIVSSQRCSMSAFPLVMLSDLSRSLATACLSSTLARAFPFMLH
eukprot:m.112789 g.112789  ORF g.112789 m.112789 type:complete len:109 (+) comp13489_c1_seq1:924-1250(+)